MARKSRKNMMPQAAVQEAVQQNEKELLRTAAYARLSVENGGHETEDPLHTQILQIHNYISCVLCGLFCYMISGLQNQIPKPYSMAFISLTIRVRISCSISLQSKRRR